MWRLCLSLVLADTRLRRASGTPVRTRANSPLRRRAKGLRLYGL